MSRQYIANTLKRLREARGLTANEVGVLVGKSGKTVNAWENNRGQPDAEMLIKLCDIYNVEDILAEFKADMIDIHSIEKHEAITLTPHEEKVISSYRNHPEMQPAVDKVLGIDTPEEKITVFRAARSDSDIPSGEVEMPKTQLDKLKSLPTVTSDDEI
ncbi:MAG: helix-turn-helix transcriptional regulator [Clostridia bacterium]